MRTIKLVLVLISIGVLNLAANDNKDSNKEVSNEELQAIVKTLKKIKISGYLQTEYQYGQQDASLNVGGENENPEHPFNRIGIRRGRVKFAFQEGIATAVFQLNMNEKGVTIKDLYLDLTAPWNKYSFVRAGVFNLPFGYEIEYSSSQRETPERAMVIQKLFPDQRDLGGMITFQPNEKSALHFITLQAGLFSGNGINKDMDNHKDFVGQITTSALKYGIFDFGFGFSYYNGGVYQGSEKVYKMKDRGFVVDDNEKNIGKYAKREYFGLNLEVAAKNSFGNTKLHTEYIWGTQPGTDKSSKSLITTSISTADTYIRNFRGGYVMLVQNLGSSPLAALAKYDWYDPNTKVSKNEIGLNGTGKADISYNTIGLGIMWNINKQLRMQTYYEWVMNEKSENLEGYTHHRKENVLTCRLQYKF